MLNLCCLLYNIIIFTFSAYLDIVPLKCIEISGYDSTILTAVKQ